MVNPYAWVRPLLFSGALGDAEALHRRVLSLAERVSDGGMAWVQAAGRRWFAAPDPSLEQSLWGLRFPNPLGLAAGFDKDGQGAALWPCLGFGFIELGTVTWHPQPGNPRPRLFRLPADQAVINRMGFNNQGATALAQRLAHLRQRTTLTVPVGINLGKSKITPLAEAVQDYEASFRVLEPWGDYFVINVSSPNTPGLRQLQTRPALEPILEALQRLNGRAKPLLVKVAPDLDDAALVEIADLAVDYRLGLIATNTTITRPTLKTQVIQATGRPAAEETGGLSGAPLRARSTEVIRQLYHHTQGRIPIIGVGGIFTAADAWEKVTAGASLLQTYTGWVYTGPWGVREMLTGLSQRLQAASLPNLAAAVGLEQPAGRP
ncbi:MAG: quinone-dependent dihydroorotate dehydrogenase [Gloeomargaritaceae cyanobacterium C42_A2020_066]|nr:quinone-dependent dihydroorotate dehydrogenase [Gloeomargaritaceae cyanobacterium C42_A2020_066]